MTILEESSASGSPEESPIQGMQIQHGRVQEPDSPPGGKVQSFRGEV